MNIPLESAGHLLGESQAMVFLIAWIVTVLLYGFYRSAGEAKQDPVRPSGPS